MRAAMTPGTAYGTKIAIRENRPRRVDGLSSSRANSSASPMVTGTAMAA